MKHAAHAREPHPHGQKLSATHRCAFAAVNIARITQASNNLHAPQNVCSAPTDALQSVALKNQGPQTYHNVSKLAAY